MKHFGLLGHPLGHSRSPQLHRLLAGMLGEEMEYALLEIPPQQLEERRGELFSLDGFNVTIPHKTRILPLLDALDPTARLHGAVNTVVRDAQDRWVGHNTDCTGFVRSMELEGVPLSGSVCVVGCGGVGRVFATECASRGCQVTLAVRPNRLEEAQALAQQLESRFGGVVQALPVGELKGPFALLINATPAGMYPNTHQCPVEPRLLSQVETVFDCIYNPRQTLLMRQGAQRGCRVCGGMKMLVLQAAAAQELWLGRRFLPQQLLEAVERMESGEEG